ncbi:MAG: hypothetical protein QM698_04450 [Micropepsaceae bacterium]
MTMRAALLALLAAMPAAAAAADGDLEIRTICERICGTWDPVPSDQSGPGASLELHFDPASGEIRGSRSIALPDRAPASVDIVIAYMPETGSVRMVVGDIRVGADISTAYIDPDLIVFTGVVPGKPDLTAVTQFIRRAPDTLYEVQPESAEQYNSMGFEQTYTLVKK